MTDSDHDICHDFEDNILENSRDSIEVDDEISINPTDFAEKITRSPKDAHLKPERWKYKTRKKRKKSQGNAGDEILDDESEKRVENENIECSSVENSVDLDLIKTKYAKMSKTAKQSDYGKELYNILNCKNKSTGLDSAGNSEHQSSSDDAIRKPIPTWKDKTVECEVCGKEMLRSRLKKHVKIAHKSKKLYPCDECSFNAENLIELKKHLRKRHKLSTGTVRKMVKLMKMNRKHRRSVLEDDLEDIPLARRRLLPVMEVIQSRRRSRWAEEEWCRKARQRAVARDPARLRRTPLQSRQGSEQVLAVARRSVKAAALVRRQAKSWELVRK